MEKKTNKGLIAAGIAIGVVACILIGVLIGMFILRGGNGSEELVTDAFCELNKSSGEDYYYRIPKLNIDKPWAEEVNEKMYNTLYDEYQKGTVLYDGENPASAEMGYEWTEKDSVISIVVQIKNNITDGYEFFTFNIDTDKEREITDEELIEIFGYEKNGYFDRIRESVRGIYDKEISAMPPTDYVYDSLLDASQSSDTLENSMSFITPEGELNVIIPVFSGEEKDNVLSIIDPETGDKKDYFTFDDEYKEIIPENDLAENETAATGNEDVERLELTDADISELMNIMVRDLGFRNFDCENTDTSDIITNQLTFDLGVHFYSLYFDDYIKYDDYSGTGVYIRPKVPDPLNKIHSDLPYMVLPEENVKWLVENIYHTEYDESFADSADSTVYAYEGNVYVALGYGGDISPKPELVNTIRLNDGRYEVSFHNMSTMSFDRGDSENIYNYTVITLDVQLIDGKRCLTFYKIENMNEREFRAHSVNDYGESSSDDTAKPQKGDLQDLFNMAAYGMADFNSNTVDTAYVINKYITSITGIGDYAIYFNDAKVHSIYMEDNSPSDPRGRFDTYSKLPAENVKWMCENVYNIEFDENYVSDNSYCEGGYVYTYAIIAGDGPRVSQVKTMEKMSDGRYSIVLENGWNYDNPDVIDVEREIYIIAEIKTTDGIRHWSFYDVKTKNLRTY